LITSNSYRYGTNGIETSGVVAIMFKTLDIAIGIGFIYLLTTFVASAVVEFISNWLNWRGEMLHAGIGNMLAGSTLVNANDIYSDPLIVNLGRNDAAPSTLDFLEKRGWRPVIHGKHVTFPSYIPAASFSSAVLDALILKASASTPAPVNPASMVAIIQTELGAAKTKDGFKADALRAVIETTLAARGANMQAFQFALEKWFNDTMDRVSGWYKRRTQSCLLIIGLVLAFGCNIDTIGIGLWLWNGDAARQAVVSAAADYSKSHTLPPTVTNDAGGKKVMADAVKTMTQQVADADRQVTALQFPIGWPVKFDVFWLLQYLVGSLLSAIAISMGSTFWFNALQSLINLRGAGPKPDAR
jgi:hypothetical protein